MNKKILIFADYYLPGHRAGGPVRSLEALIENFKGDLDFKLITRNHDFKLKTPYSVKCGAELQVGAAVVEYYPTSKLFFIHLLKILKASKAEIIYLNSFFSFYYSILPLILCQLFFRKKFKILLAPRGELCVGALSLKSFKKNCYLKLSRFLYKNVAWQITHENERSVIQKFFGTEARIYLAPNLQLMHNHVECELSKNPGELKILFLSRLSVKKNLHYALTILKNVSSGDIRFDIYGSIEDPVYWEEVGALMKEMPKNIRVNYLGEVAPLSVIKLMANYHLFFLPSLSENYAHAVLEALRAGCPVLSSDQIPWLQLEEKGCGWNIPLSQGGEYERVINELLAMSDEKFQVMRSLAKNYATECLRLAEVISENQKMFNELLV